MFNSRAPLSLLESWLEYTNVNVKFTAIRFFIAAQTCAKMKGREMKVVGSRHRLLRSRCANGRYAATDLAAYSLASHLRPDSRMRERRNSW
jgi:hypothetical protein